MLAPPAGFLTIQISILRLRRLKPWRSLTHLIGIVFPLPRPHNGVTPASSIWSAPAALVSRRWKGTEFEAWVEICRETSTPQGYCALDAVIVEENEQVSQPCYVRRSRPISDCVSSMATAACASIREQ